MSTLAAFVWRLVPTVLRRVAPNLALVLVDGLYLPIDWLRNAVPIALFVFGALWGGYRIGFEMTFSESILLMVIFVVLGSLLSSAAAWLTIGFVVGDLVASALHQPDFMHVVLSTLSRSIACFLLALLAIFLPRLARQFGKARLPNAFSRHRIIEWSVRLLLVAAANTTLLWIWIHVVPILIRPVFTWLDYLPEQSAMYPLQAHGIWLIAAGTLAGMARNILEYAIPSAVQIPVEASGVRAALIRGARQRTREWTPSRIFLQILLTTWLLSGLFMSWLDAAIMVLAQLAYHGIRIGLSKRARHWAPAIRRVPVAVRLAVWALTMYGASAATLSVLWGKDDTFRPVVFAVALSLCLYAFFFPVPDASGETH